MSRGPYVKTAGAPPAPPRTGGRPPVPPLSWLKPGFSMRSQSVGRQLGGPAPPPSQVRLLDGMNVLIMGAVVLGDSSARPAC